MRGTLRISTTRRSATLGWLTLLLYAHLSLLLPFCRSTDTGYRRPGAMVEGCSTKSCCTSRCYLDDHGVHHCVHEPGDSCDCDMSSGEPQIAFSLPDLVPPETAGTCSNAGLTLRSIEFPEILTNLILAVPVPPPRALPS